MSRGPTTAPFTAQAGFKFRHSGRNRALMSDNLAALRRNVSQDRRTMDGPSIRLTDQRQFKGPPRSKLRRKNDSEDFDQES
jgi:hypothetical protein